MRTTVGKLFHLKGSLNGPIPPTRARGTSVNATSDHEAGTARSKAGGPPHWAGYPKSTHTEEMKFPRNTKNAAQLVLLLSRIRQTPHSDTNSTQVSDGDQKWHCTATRTAHKSATATRSGTAQLHVLTRPTQYAPHAVVSDGDQKWHCTAPRAYTPNAEETNYEENQGD